MKYVINIFYISKKRRKKHKIPALIINTKYSIDFFVILMPPVNGYSRKAETNLKSGMRALERGSAKDSLRVYTERVLM